jgi:hypothetical protein
MEWVMADRHSRTSERISMVGLRSDLHAAIGAFAAMLAYAESFVERAPRPINFCGRTYLGPPDNVRFSVVARGSESALFRS